MDEKQRFYEFVADEIERNEFDKGLMTRAVAKAKGNRDLAHGLYIDLRVDALEKGDRERHATERRRERERRRLEREQRDVDPGRLIALLLVGLFALALLMFLIQGSLE